MSWNIDFITEENFTNHIKETITSYGNKLQPYDLTKFNSNTIDPIKLIFDKEIYNHSWEEIISSEIIRQRDKSNTNEIGYFHQKIFQYISGCHVPANGKEGGWDIIYENPEGYKISDTNVVHKIYVEMKNKHNTMNSASAQKTYMKMQNQLLEDDDCCCFLVEAIAKKSQNIIWKTTLTTGTHKSNVSHARIRRVSIDEFYKIVTGEPDSFLMICKAIPATIEKVLKSDVINVDPPVDTVFEEIKKRADSLKSEETDTAMILAIYSLGFGSYLGFNSFDSN